MGFSNPLQQFVSYDFFESLLPDFVLACAFFTAIIYAALGKRFGHQRAAIGVALAMGVALAVGLVWWEEANDISIRDLGPLAAGFALILLAGVIYQSIKGVGGNWAGAGIAVGACILVGWAVGIDWPARPEIVQAVLTVTLTVGILAFLFHRHGIHSYGADFGPSSPVELNDLRHDVRDLYQERKVADRVTDSFQKLRRAAEVLPEHPEAEPDVMLQLQRMLPAEGWLTDQMARLREKAYHFRVGHVTQIEEMQKHLSRLPVQARRKAASELAVLYKELQFDARLDRLDRAVVANERRVRELTRGAEVLLQRHDHKDLVDVLAAAGKLQKHNAHLLRAIRRTEKRLLHAAKSVATKYGGVKTQ